MGTVKALELIEEAFSKYLMNESSLNELENTLAVGLNNLPIEPQRDFKVTVKLENRIGHNFFGMECFPAIEEMRQQCYELSSDEPLDPENFIKRWRGIEKWTVVIDLLCLDRDFINFNPKELTAMLVHEVGYVLASDQPVLVFLEKYMEAKARQPRLNKTYTRYLTMLYAIPLSIACTPRLWLQDSDTLMMSIDADRTLIDNDYAEHLGSAVAKIVKAVGSEVYAPNNYNDMSASLDWVNLHILDVVKRKNMIKDDLYYIAIRRNDAYFPALCSFILDELGAKLRERYTGYVAESYGNGVEALANGEISLEKYTPIFDIAKISNFERAWTSAEESFFNRITKKRVSLPNQYDIDRIAVEIDKMQNQYDRIYVLDMIYAQIQKIDLFEESLIDNPSMARRWEKDIAAMRANLEVLRQAVLAKTNFDKSYKLWVKDIPAGYEG